GRIETVRVVPEASAVANYGFDVTPARLVTGLVTERGIVAARRDALAAAFVERAQGPPRSGAGWGKFRLAVSGVLRVDPLIRGGRDLGSGTQPWRARAEYDPLYGDRLGE